MDLDQVNTIRFDVYGNEVVESHQLHSGNNPTGSTRTCSGTCTSVNHGCKSASTGDCKCFAPPVSLFYWHLGDCGTRLPFKAKRDLAQQRHSYYLNATAQFAQYASFSHATATPPPPPDLHAQQLASGLLPSPCNASYVSFACSDSPDGIVHEPPQNWLGALVPEGAKELPPVPTEFSSWWEGGEDAGVTAGCGLRRFGIGWEEGLV
ncbi:hypothetical protein MMC22_002421 [Lobaria immixta]|nr:hypothetical protein [Lobaria immixta]